MQVHVRGLKTFSVSLQVEIVTLEEGGSELRSDRRLTFDHPFPATKLMFMPDKEGARPDLLATSADFLRLWKVQKQASQRFRSTRAAPVLIRQACANL